MHAAVSDMADIAEHGINQIRTNLGDAARTKKMCQVSILSKHVKMQVFVAFRLDAEYDEYF